MTTDEARCCRLRGELRPRPTPSPAKIVTSSGVNQDRISEYQHFGFSAVNEPFSFFERQAACATDSTRRWPRSCRSAPPPWRALSYGSCLSLAVAGALLLVAVLLFGEL